MVTWQPHTKTAHVEMMVRICSHPHFYFVCCCVFCMDRALHNFFSTRMHYLLRNLCNHCKLFACYVLWQCNHLWQTCNTSYIGDLCQCVLLFSSFRFFTYQLISSPTTVDRDGAEEFWDKKLAMCVGPRCLTTEIICKHKHIFLYVPQLDVYFSFLVVTPSSFSPWPVTIAMLMARINWQSSKNFSKVWTVNLPYLRANWVSASVVLYISLVLQQINLLSQHV